MRKYLLIVMAVLFVAAISSCTKKYVTPNNNITVKGTVKANSWVLSSDGKSYESEIQVADLDSYYNNDGAVLVYASFGAGVYEQIPQVYDGVAYSYYHKTGKIVLYAQTPGNTPVKPDTDFEVKIVLIDSVY